MNKKPVRLRVLAYLALVFVITLFLARPLTWLLNGLVFTAHPSLHPARSGFDPFEFRLLSLLHPFFLAPSIWALLQETYLMRFAWPNPSAFRSKRSSRYLGFLIVSLLMVPIMTANSVLTWNRPGVMNAMASGVYFSFLAIPSLVVSMALRTKIVQTPSRMVQWTISLAGLIALPAIAFVLALLWGDDDGDTQVFVWMMMYCGLIAFAGGALGHLLAGRNVFRSPSAEE